MSSIIEPNISVYSIVLTSCSFLTSHSCVSHSCTHCLAVFQSHTSDIPVLITMLSDSIYQTLNFVCIKHVQISTLIIVLIVYSTSGHFQHHSELPKSDFQTIGKTLSIIK